MIKPNPFTPKSGLEPKVFVNREKEIQLFLKRINEGKQGVTNHFIVNGALLYLGKVVYEGIVSGISLQEMGVFMNMDPKRNNRLVELAKGRNKDRLYVHLHRLVEKGLIKKVGRAEYAIKDNMLWEYCNIHN